MRRHVAIAVIVCGLVGSACSRNDGRTMRPPAGDQSGTIAQDTTTVAGEFVSPGDDVPMTVTGPWIESGSIEAKHTCAGANVSPPLFWSAIPTEAVTLALVLVDEDNPSFDHWVVANIPADSRGIAAGETVLTAVSALNSSGFEGYAGPCPPRGTSHIYTLTLYAVSQQLEVLPGDPADLMTAAITAAAIDAVSTSFTFSR